MSYGVIHKISLSTLVVKRTCKDTEFCIAVLARKKVKHVSRRALALC